MLYLGIDLHRKQMTINLRNADGDVLVRRQVSTWGGEPVKFLNEVAGRDPAGYAAIVENCGFHEWLTELLPEHGCREVVLIQADSRSRRKTDRRDANQLSELLWLNRERLLKGQRVRGLRRIVPPTSRDRDDRRLTQLRLNVTADLTRKINGVRHLLRRLNLEQQCPTKGIQTLKARAWLKTLPLPDLDRFEMNQRLVSWRSLEKQRRQIDERIAQRAAKHPQVALLKTIPGVSSYTALALASRIGDIKRFATPRSLANYWGLTPSCRNSGETNQRLGAITKEGSALARYVLGQLVLHVLRKDPVMREWFRRIKRRRGAKIARVAVMRRLAVIIWHMLTHQVPYEVARPSRRRPSPRQAGRLPSWRRCWGFCPQTPGIYRLGLNSKDGLVQTRSQKNERTTFAVRSSNSARVGRSGCFPAGPYPPARLSASFAKRLGENKVGKTTTQSDAQLTASVKQHREIHTP
jgi:transposase